MEKYNKNLIWSADQATNAFAKEVEDYIQAQIKDYKEDNMNSNKLCNIWKGDFTSFIAITFDKARKVTKILQDFLYANGVYIKKTRHIIVDKLFEML